MLNNDSNENETKEEKKTKSKQIFSHTLAQKSFGL